MVIGHWRDYSYCNINCGVTAWQPLPAPCRPKEEDDV